ncbi:hypothetical protein EXS56_00180 [Candidatus Kaiserbacteria bacterium]|nr:hypothetical protein [Candidatus Kaiserbacteria bacterium]
MLLNKIVASGVVAVSLFGASIASAQSYYPSYNYGTTYTQPYSGACVSLATDLSYGSRGSQVSQLQTFLVSRNYPGGGSWMITGSFRTATLTAVKNFQIEQNLPTTGVVDAATRAAISRVSCGGSVGYNYNNYNYNTNPYTYSALPTYNYNNNYNNNSNCYYTYPYTCNNQYNYGYGVSLTSLSPVSGEPGTSLIIYGTNLDNVNNTVYFGSQPVANVPSSNGTSLTVTVPGGITPGGAGVYVTNSRGTSNTLTFNVIARYSACNYPYSYGTYNTTYCPPNVNTPYITYLNPASGAVGSTVTVYGSGFSPTGNTVHFGGGVITGLNSTDGRTVSFIVPSSLFGYTSQVVTLSTYNVSVSSFSGQTSNALPFAVTSTGTAGAASIMSVAGPTTLSTGGMGTWTITLNNQYNSYLTTSVNWGDAGSGYGNTSSPQSTYAQGTNTLSFTHTYYAPGTYTVVFTVANSAGQQNTATATVTVSNTGTYGNVSLSYLTPTSGRVGTQVMLQGTGFNALDNAVHFGIGGTLHAPSFNNGTTIYYTIPYAVSPCDLVGFGCTAPTTLVIPNSYPLYVTNSQGTSQTLQFAVTN